MSFSDDSDTSSNTNIEQACRDVDLDSDESVNPANASNTVPSQDLETAERIHALHILGLVDRLVEDEEPPPERPASMKELIVSLRMSKDDQSVLDDAIKMRVRDFEDAQKERHTKKSMRPFGIVGLFSNLSYIRSDLRWAEDAAFRREKGKPHVTWQDFEARRTRGLNRPYFTYLILLTSIVMMVVAFYLNGWKIEPLEVNPLFGPSPDTLLRLGALQTRLMIETNSWYRLVTPVVLHGGIIHLLINLSVIALMGRAIERNHGFFNTAALFFIPAIGGNIMSGVMQPNYILVGASGGIFGLIGVCVADVVLNWKLIFLVFKNLGRSGCWMRFCCIFWLCFDLVFNSFIGFTPFVDNFAHMGGLIYGFLVALSMLEPLPLSFFGKTDGICHRVRICVLRLGGATIAAFLVCLTTILLSQSDGLISPCQSCRYISCIPFPFWSEKKWWYCDGCDAVSGDIFKRRGDAYFSDLELFCPSGEVAEIDIFDKRFEEPSDLQLALPSICRDNC